jgi:uncharacterized membrane protein
MKQQYFNVSRIHGISDGVFAIAMTLLVLDIEVPQLTGAISGDVFRDALLEELPSIIAWLISFALLCRLWITQHALLEGGKRRTRAFVGMNFAFLGMVSFIPFPTALMSEHPEQAFSVIIFSACYALAGLALAGMWFLLERSEQRPTDSSDRPVSVPQSVKRVIILLPALAVIASLLTLVDPRLGVAVWVIMPFLGITTRH